jgi:biotin synthase
VRVIAVARLMMPKAHVRLSAGREAMSDELQAMCFMAGANSMFYGERLLTTGNPDVARDQQLFARLGLKAEAAHVQADADAESNDACGHRHAHTPPEPEVIHAT